MLKFLYEFMGQKRHFWFSISVFFLLIGAFLVVENVSAATLRLPGNCSSVSSCISSMSSGDTLLIADGTYTDSISGIKSNTTIQAENDGKVKFTGSFSPGSAGFTMQGIVVKSSDQKDLGSGNTYRRMSFIGGPSCGNVVNSSVGSNTKIYNSAFYGLGGRYLILAYQQNGGIVLQDVIFRPDGGWGNGSSCNGWEPHAAYNMYDTEGFTITGAILVDAISTASGESENIGGQVVNTHQNHSNVGTISQSVITTSGNYGRFASDGGGSHNLTITDSVAKGNSFDWGLSRSVQGTTSATRFDSDKKVESWNGSINRTTGANLVLNTSFLNDARWKQEMCADAGVTRGFCSGSALLGDYVATNLGISTPTPDTTPPTLPANFNLSATSPSQSSISVSWNPATDNIAVTGYIVERCQGSSCSTFTQVGTPTTSPFVDSGLTANTFYNYHVRARDAAGNLSGWSNVVGATTQAPDTTPPTAPSNLQTSVVSSSNVNITWTASTDTVGVTGYKVERCSGASCTNFTEIGTPTATSYSDTGLTASTTYRYRVRATDAANNLSSYSAIANATTPEVPPVSASLMIGYNFNEGTGTTIADISGHNHTGTLSTTTWSTGGKYGNALNFNGSTSFVETPNTSSLNITGNAITLSAWVYPDTLGTNMLIAKPVSGTSHSAPYFSYSLHLYPSGTPRFYLTLGSSSYSVSSLVIPQVGVWSHLAGVYNGSTMKIYVNGQESGSISASGNITGYATPLRLGVNGGLEENFDGRLDDVRIYNTALTQTEIQTDMNTPLTQPTSAQSCNTVTTTNFSQSAYNSYGAPFDAFQTSTNLMNTTCTSADTHTINLTTGVTGDTTRIVYTKGYWYDAVTTAWRQYAGTCTGALNGEWCQGSVSATITDPNVSTASAGAPTYLVGMTCSVQGGSWKCGCRDTSCTSFSWQIQGAGM